jgi:hypothetical protein
LGSYRDWVDWHTYVKKKVEQGILNDSCLSILEDGGGKVAANQRFEIQLAQSPLKKKKTRCTVHDFKAEDDKSCAQKGTGFILDAIICEGYDNKLLWKGIC